VLITGTSSGIGRACSLSLARLGVTVLATVRKQSDVEKWHQDYPELAQHIVPIILGTNNLFFSIGSIVDPLFQMYLMTRALNNQCQ